ncbi:Rubrerythrin [Desulfacinum hydrothermale DSM 13146]|uniref:Rubrerythrin n=1 Tax=Desulfacinum hydrothermale DSM 13146 TaxID=1121390 RepID=A0A1W1WZY6_9BACT|nr:rubrerythrin family protein [Desulfacinum hydrothermale]SMC17292.1 Rubrerythrin [Desulfacinum hydrothermale DSM 13146]
MEEKRKALMLEAFTGEARAHFRLLLFAQRADEEGYPQIARLFRAVAEAERVHARNHAMLLESVGSTEDNLKAAFETETFANQVAYPKLLKEAWALEDKAAIWFLSSARNAEERHARLYKHALEDLVAERMPVYQVCSHCGWIEEGEAPQMCPNCNKPRDYFIRIGD